ncbi:hypothetical protein HD554DRAFT_2039139 [Boletus coccyginus]|nr:hypothetical protein HD554DRAFT_2039139 [Boletus coccyginus]
MSSSRIERVEMPPSLVLVLSRQWSWCCADGFGAWFAKWDVGELGPCVSNGNLSASCGQIPKSHPWHHPSSDEMSDYSMCQSTLSDVRHPRLKKEEKRRRKGKGGNLEGAFAVTPRGLGIQDPSWPPDHRGRIAVLIRRSSDAIGSLARSSCDDKVVWVGACDVVIGHDRCVRVRVTISGYRRWLGLTSGGSQGEKDHPRCTGLWWLGTRALRQDEHEPRFNPRYLCHCLAIAGDARPT